MKNKILVFIMMCFVFVTVAQDKLQKNFGIKFSGFVKNDFFMDTRQNITEGEGNFLLWPSAASMDANDKDINKGLNFNFLALQSRLSGNISGPDFMGARTSGIIEADFFTHSDDNIGLLKLRHAMIKLNWKNIEILTGQYWNPLFVTGCFPGTVSLNTGAPLQSYSFNPQFRLTLSFGDVKLIGAALAQREYSSWGPNGESSEYLRNSGTPDMHVQLHYDSELILGGFGLAFKSIVPRLSSTGLQGTFRIREKVKSLTAIGFARISYNPITIKAQARYGQNIPDVLSISGFAIQDIIDPNTGERSYIPLHNLTAWGEISAKIDNFETGMFGGLFLNLGTTKEMSNINNTVYGLATNISSLVRISPRILYTVNKICIAGELEYTLAAYGINYNTNYKPEDVDVVNNLRLLLSFYYFF